MADGPLARLGGFLFRRRDILPLPFFLLLLPFLRPEPIPVLSGVIFVLCGELIRFYSVLYIGPESRTRGEGVERLVTHGPFSLVRNPIYIGNFLISWGIILISGIRVLFILFPPLFFLYYHSIVLWEEGILSKRFGSLYEDYKSNVNRWIPSLKRGLMKGERVSLDSAWRSEKKTLLTLAFAAAVIIICSFLI